MMNYHMLLWNPKESVPVEEVEAWNGKGSWSVGNLKVKPGDLCFLRRCQSGKLSGIIAYGEARSKKPIKREHWRYSYGTETPKNKPVENQVDIVVKKLFLDRPITVRALKELGFTHLPWTRQQPTTLAQIDGEEIKDHCDAHWKKRG